ncbi:hypothetical protein HanIR_Chr16g0791991 [Helianthus annuus]|nr:hypothetical protein HanIR_Chr16g0791991 [Helianthus annuus]
MNVANYQSGRGRGRGCGLGRGNTQRRESHKSKIVVANQVDTIRGDLQRAKISGSSQYRHSYNLWFKGRKL